MGHLFISGGIPILNNKIIIDRYIMYGLNRNRKFLSKTRKTILLPDLDTMQEYTAKVLSNMSCDCALFFIHLDETYSAYFKVIMDSEFVDEDIDDLDDEDCQMKITYALCRTDRKDDTHMFSELDGEYRFHCYSLLQEIEEGLYEVC